MQHFQQIFRVFMFPMEVPQPLQQPMLLHKPLASFVVLYTQPNSNRYYDLHPTFHRLYHSSLEISLQYLKWVFCGISFGFLVERYHRLNFSLYLTQGGHVYHHLQQYFSPCSGNYRSSFTYGWKYIFNILNGYFAEFHFVSCFEIYH